MPQKSNHIPARHRRPTAKRGGDIQREDTRSAFLNALATGLTVEQAADIARVSRQALYAARVKDADFDRAWVEARTAGEKAVADRLEAAIERRAIEGWDDPVFQGGKLVGHKRKYSDLLAMFRMKSLAPDRYRDNIDVTHTHRIVDLRAAMNEGLRRAGLLIDGQASEVREEPPIGAPAVQDDGTDE